ncbi:hypothetical protein L6452_09009 [Arctium lappa]|uniref:Uncharacterized protein n=1 Tax=Arctium lappa TaxID=4217 RepID=A0ACB9DJG2_ARCLA|nr:hypothetical protein L6452_09009 [Arctium lappa]
MILKNSHGRSRMVKRLRFLMIRIRTMKDFEDENFQVWISHVREMRKVQNSHASLMRNVHTNSLSIKKILSACEKLEFARRPMRILRFQGKPHANCAKLNSDLRIVEVMRKCLLPDATSFEVMVYITSDIKVETSKIRATFKGEVEEL